MSNAYSGLLKEFVDNIINFGLFGVKENILNGKKYCIVAGNAVWYGDRLVGVVDPEAGWVEDFFSEGDFYAVNDELFYMCEGDLETSEDIVPLIAEYEGKGEFLVLGGQLDFSKDYVLGQDREGTFAYFVKNVAGIENLIVLDKTVLLKDWDIVKGIDEEWLSKIRSVEELPIGCCESVFDVLSFNTESGYATLPCLQVESVLDSKYMGKYGSHKDISEILTDKRLNIIRNTISSVKLLTDSRVSSGEVKGTEVREGSFCLFNGLRERLWIATVATTDKKYEECRVVPVDVSVRRARIDSLLLRRVRGCDIDKWNYGDCFDSIYEFAELVNNIVEKNSNLDVQSVFVFPCGINDKPKAYVSRNYDGSCTVSMIVPYYK